MSEEASWTHLPKTIKQPDLKTVNSHIMFTIDKVKPDNIYVKILIYNSRMRKTFIIWLFFSG